MDITIIEAIGSATLAILGWAILIATSWIKRRWAHDIVDRLGELAVHVVRYVWQTYVEELKAQGEFNTEAQKVALGLALERLRSDLGPKGLQAVAWLFGFNDSELENFLKTHIESAIVAEKK